MCNLSKHHAVVNWDHIHLAGKRQFFFIFQSPDGKFIAIGAMILLSTFLMLLLENWFTPLKELYGLFLKDCDVVPCAVVFRLISYNV